MLPLARRPRRERATGESSLLARKKAIETRISALEEHIKEQRRLLSDVEAKLADASTVPIPPVDRANNPPNVRIYILCHNEERYNFALKAFEPYYWAVPIRMKYQNCTFENAFWRQLLEIREEWENCDMVGTLSSKAPKKLNLKSVHQTILNRSAWSSGYYNFTAVRKPVNGGGHPHLMTILNDVIRQLNVSHPPSSTCNYWMCSPERMIKFIQWHETVLAPAVLEHPLAMTDAKYRGELTAEQCKALCGVPYYPHIPFALERLNIAFFTNTNLPSSATVSYDIETTVPNFAFVFVCHDRLISLDLLHKYPNCYILYVGTQNSIVNHPRCIVVRNLENNIEQYNKLLTFTAWYAIVKNDIFKEYEYICVLEYDVVLPSNFISLLNNSIGNADVIHLIPLLKSGKDIRLDIMWPVLNEFITGSTKEYVDSSIDWYPTTNFCMKRTVISMFVDYYYPRCCGYILDKDNANASWYHERIFSYFILHNKLCVESGPVIKHQQSNSHSIFNNKGICRYKHSGIDISVQHSHGFFSNCSVTLDFIVRYINKYRKYPNIIDTTKSFNWYKTDDLINQDIFPYFFNDSTYKIHNVEPIQFMENYQYKDFKLLDYNRISPLINTYFSISSTIRELVSDLENKYNLDDYSNIVTLFYRGNDKITETKLASYDDYIKYAREILQKKPNVRFLVQSDETEFIQHMLEQIPGTFYFKDEIRHIKRSINTVDKVDKETNFKYSQYFLAIINIMAKTDTIICGDGNCSMWIMLYRGHADRVYEFCQGKWITPV